MSSLRYGSSFIISSLLYGALAYSLLYFLETHKRVPKKISNNIIKIALINPKPKVITPPKKIVKPKPKPKPKPKKIIKKVIKKLKHKPKKIKKVKPKHKVKKIVKKIKPKQIIKREEPIIEEEYFEPEPVRQKEYFAPEPIREERDYSPTIPVREKSYSTPVTVPRRVVKYLEPQVVQTPMAPQTIEQPKADKGEEKRAFLRRVRNQIKGNKKYPRMAIKRHIEGSVGIIFDIASDGSVSNINFLNGKSILQKAVRKALLRSFPINIPSELRGKFPMYNISVTVNFNIR